jgi:SAM-dependent methyltransferase
VDFGSLRRLTPISPVWGLDRGRPIDRYYIEGFLGRHAGDVRGAVLEVGDDVYTRRFGGDRVTRSDILHVDPQAPRATLAGDLAAGDGLPSEAFDCIILTQTLDLIYDSRAALRTVRRMLRPGGVLLATVNGITQVTGDEWDDSRYWRFTPLGIRRLFEEAFPADGVAVEAHGNVLAATAFLQGLAAEELTPAELDHVHPGYDVSIAIRAVRPVTG